MNKHRVGAIPLILIAILALVVAVGGIGIGLAWKTDVLDKWLPNSVKEFFGKEVTTDGEPTNGEEPINGENGEPTEDPTKDWKTYTNEAYGYSVKYPKDWYVNFGNQGDPTFPSETVNFTRVNDPNHREIWISQWDSGGKSARDFARELADNVAGSSPEYIQDKGEVVVGGATGYQVNATTPSPYPPALDDLDLIIVVIRGGKAYSFWTGVGIDPTTKEIANTEGNDSIGRKAVYDLMVASFGFVE